MKLDSGFKRLSAALFFTLFTSTASAAIFMDCVPDSGAWEFAQDDQKPIAMERERRACEAENAVYAEWEQKLVTLDIAQQDMAMAVNAGDWKAFRTTMATVVPALKDFAATANANRTVAGAANFLSLYSADIGYFFQNAGLPRPSGLDDALAKIDAALDTPKASDAATVAFSLVQQTVIRGQEMGLGLGRLASGNIRKEASEAQAIRTETRREHLKPTSADGYFSGFGDRLGMFWVAVFGYSLFAVFVAGWLGRKNNRQDWVKRTAVCAPVAGLAAWLLQLVLPFFSDWVTAFVWGAVFTGLWFFSLHLGLFVSKANNGLPNVVGSGKDTHGSARWGTAADMLAHDRLHRLGALPQEFGFALGRATDAGVGLDNRLRNVGHVVTCAKTRSGKGVGCVVPTLLEYPGSALVIDIKGENYAVTARRRRELGQSVYLIDPFGVTGEPAHGFNWLDRIDLASEDCIGRAAVLADSIVLVEKDGDHWDETAKDLIRGLILHTASLPDDRRHMGELRRLIAGSEDELNGVLLDMAESEAGFGIVARAANTFLAMADKERSSVLSSARRHTAFLDDPRISRSLERSDFRLDRLKKELMTVYLVMPPDRLRSNVRFLRSLVNEALDGITADNVQPRHKVAFILDEFPKLGHMPKIEDAMGLVAGYGMALWVFVQDLSQLKGVYPKWETFVANATKQFFGTGDPSTAKYVSELLGKATVEFETESSSRSSGRNLGLSGGGGSTGSNKGTSDSQSQQFTGRALLTEDEVMRLGSRPVVFATGEYPYLLDPINYLQDADYQGQADANPFHAKAMA